MIDIDYYRKIQNAYGTKSYQEVQRNIVKNDLNRDFTKPLDAYTVLINDVEQDLTILETNDKYTKKIKSRPDESFKIGQIVFWQNSYWIIKEVDTNKSIITQGTMTECNQILYWQNAEGKIVSKHVYIEDFTKYSNGESSNNTVTFGNNQYGVYISIDEDTKKLTRGMRFVCDFQDSLSPDVYELTNRKVSLYDYQDIGKGGLILLTFSFNVFNPSTDKKVRLDDGNEVWICNYVSKSTNNNDNSENDIQAQIIGDDFIHINQENIWNVTFKDKNDESIDYLDYTWNIEADFNLNKVIKNNSIQLLITDDSLIDESFILKILDKDNSVLADKIINITEGY